MYARYCWQLACVSQNKKVFRLVLSGLDAIEENTELEEVQDKVATVKNTAMSVSRRSKAKKVKEILKRNVAVSDCTEAVIH